MIEGSAPGSLTAVANPIVCPYLGLADDPRTHFGFATTAHRCHSGSHPERIELTHQGTFCLGADYPTCRRYVVPTAAAAGLAVLAARAETPVAQVNGWVRWRSGVGGRRRLSLAAVGLLAALALVIVAAMLLGLGGFLPVGSSAVSGSSPTPGLANPSASEASPSVSPQPALTASIPPTSGPSPSPTRSVRALPTTHVVVRGETLTSIARLYRVTLAALEKANGIKDPSLIVVGQRLIIPAR